MSIPILAIKLRIPSPRPKAVHRPRLIERLNEGLHRKLTLLSAPAGFGKTTLASEWVAGCERPAAWLSLDKEDNDPARFLAYLVAALQGIAENVGEQALGVLQSPQPPPTESILTAVLNEITAIPDSFILVLDDYHVIDAEPIDDALTFVLRHLPPQMHLVIATREDPDLPLARLRARDQMTELRVADLRFTPSEAADFLSQVMGLNLSAEHIVALETRTEGWIAGLQLAAISMQGHPDAASFVKSLTGSHRFLMDYLVEEVLQQQPEHIQAFLLQTSMLDRMCGPLCEAVLLASPSTGLETLEYLERNNLLLVPLDDQREWYRYHQLFAEVLRARLMVERPDQVAALHLRACAWYEQNDFRSDAIHHALAAEDFERAADLIEREWSATSGTFFRSATWLGWVEALPDELVRRRPTLTLGLAWDSLFSGDLEAAEARMSDADRLLEPTADPGDASEALSPTMVVVNGEEARSLRASLALARAFHAQALGDAVGTIEYARRVLALVPVTDHYMRGLASAQLGLACWSNGDLGAAHQYMADARAGLRRAGNLLFATTCAYVLADIRIAQGRLLEAASIYQEELQLLTAHGGPVLPGTADMYLGLSELYRERGDVEAASQHLLRCEELGRQAALPEWPYGLYLAQARIRQDRGDLDGALQLLEEAERLYYRNPVPDVRPIAALKARVWIGQGRLADALEWAHRRDLSADDDLSYLREFEHLTLARLLVARYRTDKAESSIHEAVALLERLLEAADEGGRVGSVIEILVLQALAHQAQGDIPPALGPLKRALILAEPEGYVRVFVDEGRPMAELLAEMIAPRVGEDAALSEVVREHIHRLLAAFEKQEEAHPFGSAPATKTSQDTPPPLRPQPLTEPLSLRELEVLQLIAQGLSNHEIGERLFLAVSTVKGHNLRIFAKLQVRRRTEAVARARELGLLKPQR